MNQNIVRFARFFFMNDTYDECYWIHLNENVAQTLDIVCAIKIKIQAIILNYCLKNNLKKLILKNLEKL